METVILTEENAADIARRTGRSEGELRRMWQQAHIHSQMVVVYLGEDKS